MVIILQSMKGDTRSFCRSSFEGESSHLGLIIRWEPFETRSCANAFGLLLHCLFLPLNGPRSNLPIQHVLRKPPSLSLSLDIGCKNVAVVHVCICLYSTCHHDIQKLQELLWVQQCRSCSCSVCVAFIPECPKPVMPSLQQHRTST